MFWKIVKFIDKLDYKWNLFRQDDYMRKVILHFALSMIPVWFALGWDSGVKIIEDGVVALPRLIMNELSFGEWISYAYRSYGCSFHFSSYTIYGLLFWGISKHLSKLGIKRTLNLGYSVFLVLFGIGVFELWYMASFAYFQMDRNVLEWFISDFWEVPVILNFLFVVLGVFTVLAIWTDSNDYKLNWKFDYKMTMIIFVTLLSICLWIYYPLPIEQAHYEDWISNTLFPQTNYAYKAPDLYIGNFWLHLVNLIVKSYFALSLLSLVRGLHIYTKLK